MLYEAATDTLRAYMKYRSGIWDGSWMGLSCRPSCRLGSHCHASKCQEEIVGIKMPGKAK